MVDVRNRPRSYGALGLERIDSDILLVEDQRSVAIAAAKMIHERWGCHVLIATTMEQVKTIVAQKKHKFFVAVSDLSLPDAHNGEVIDVLVGANIPTVVVTGAFDHKMHGAILNKGVIDYVLKDSINAYEYIVELIGRLYRNQQIKVLVVDDDTHLCQMVEYQLNLQRLQVTVVSDCQQALDLLERVNDISLVLVDYAMPNMNGINFVANARRKYSKEKLAIISISGTTDAMVSTQFLKVGANDFIAKPFTYDELVTRVSHNLQMLENIAAIRFVAYHDYLTGLLNRRAFFEQGSCLYEKALQEKKPLVVVMMDIDFFKKINDGHGHDGGDAVLQHFAQLLGAHFGESLIARLGGEEFALIMEGTAGAIDACERFRQKIEKSPATFGDTSIPLTISIGVTSRRQDNLDATLKLADDNLYRAKLEGRNLVVAD